MPLFRISPVWALIFFLFLFNMVFFNYDYTVDSFTYARNIDVGSDLYHAHHILFNPLLYGIKSLLSLAGIKIDKSIYLIQWINILFSILSSFILFKIFTQLFYDKDIAFLITLLHAFSFGWWNYSQEAEVYIIPILLIFIQLLILCNSASLSYSKIILLAALNTLAILFHQYHVLFYFVIVLHLMLRPLSKKFKKITLFSSTVPFLSFLIYLFLASYETDFNSLSQFITWLLGYSYDSATGIHSWLSYESWLKNVAVTILALGNLFLSYDILVSSIILYSALLFITISLVTFLIMAIASKPTSIDDQDKTSCCDPIKRTLIFYFLIYVSFSTWWEPRNIEFLLPVTFVIIFFLVTIIRHHPYHKIFLTWITAGVLILNTLASYYPQHKIPERYERIIKLHSSVKLERGDMVITPEKNTVEYFNYFFNKQIVWLPGILSNSLFGAKDETLLKNRIVHKIDKGGKIYSLEINNHGRIFQIVQRLKILRRKKSNNLIKKLASFYQEFKLIKVNGYNGIYRICLDS